MFHSSHPAELGENASRSRTGHRPCVRRSAPETRWTQPNVGVWDDGASRIPIAAWQLAACRLVARSRFGENEPDGIVERVRRRAIWPYGARSRPRSSEHRSRNFVVLGVPVAKILAGLIGKYRLLLRIRMGHDWVFWQMNYVHPQAGRQPVNVERFLPPDPKDVVRPLSEIVGVLEPSPIRVSDVPYGMHGLNSVLLFAAPCAECDGQPLCTVKAGERQLLILSPPNDIAGSTLVLSAQEPTDESTDGIAHAEEIEIILGNCVQTCPVRVEHESVCG